MKRRHLICLILFAALSIAAQAQGFTATVSISPAGAGTLTTASGSCATPSGGTVTTVNFGCTATPAAGFAFQKWVVLNSAGTEQNGAGGIWVDGSTNPTAGPLALTSSGATLQAVFVATSGGGTTPPPASGCSPTAPCVNLTWNASTSNVAGAITYTVTRTPAFASPVTGLSTTSYQDATVQPNNSYTYAVAGVQGGNTSAPSNSFTVAVPAITVTITPPGTLTGTVVITLSQ